MIKQAKTITKSVFTERKNTGTQIEINSINGHVVKYKFISVNGNRIQEPIEMQMKLNHLNKFYR
jgi:hypothetical protein